MTTQFGDPRLPARFWNKVSVNEETGCWEWTGSKVKAGYGQILWVYKPPTPRPAHRVAYEMLVGPLGDLHIDHLCCNTSCVNPDHLDPCTPAENTGRNERLLPGLGELLRARREQDGLSQGDLSRLTGLSQPYISVVEAGRKAITATTICRICNATGWTPNEILPWHGHPSQK